MNNSVYDTQFALLEQAYDLIMIENRELLCENQFTDKVKEIYTKIIEFIKKMCKIIKDKTIELFNKIRRKKKNPTPDPDKKKAKKSGFVIVFATRNGVKYVSSNGIYNKFKAFINSLNVANGDTRDNISTAWDDFLNSLSGDISDASVFDEPGPAETIIKGFGKLTNYCITSVESKIRELEREENYDLANACKDILSKLNGFLGNVYIEEV